MTRPMLALALAILLAAPRARADSELSMQDLQALDKQKQWTELLDAADRVKPSARTADWTIAARTTTRSGSRRRSRGRRCCSTTTRSAARVVPPTTSPLRRPRSNRDDQATPVIARIETI